MMRTLDQLVEALSKGDLQGKISEELKRFERFKDDFDDFVVELKRMDTQLKSASPSANTIAHVTARMADLKSIGDAVDKVKSEQDFG